MHLFFSAIPSVHADRCVRTVTFIGSALESSVYSDDVPVETEAETPFSPRSLTGRE